MLAKIMKMKSELAKTIAEARSAEIIKIRRRVMKQSTEFQSADVILDIAKKEYEYERARIGRFEGRSGILFGLTGTILTFVLKYCLEFDISENKCFGIIFILLSLVPIIFFIRAMYNFFEVFSTRSYKGVSIEQVLTFVDEDRNAAMDALARHLNVLTKNNGDENEKNHLHFRKGSLVFLMD